jgi:hypothetical protein
VGTSGAPVGASVGPNLLLVKGDNPSSSKPSCSFISTTELVPVPLVNRLLTIQPDYSPDEVAANMGFPPDQPYANRVLQWSALKGGNYAKAVVNFRNPKVSTRSFTMAINYQQPNQKQCQWLVQDGLQLNQTSQPLTAP